MLRNERQKGGESDGVRGTERTGNDSAEIGDARGPASTTCATRSSFWRSHHWTRVVAAAAGRHHAGVSRSVQNTFWRHGRNNQVGETRGPWLKVPHFRPGLGLYRPHRDDPLTRIRILAAALSCPLRSSRAGCVAWVGETRGPWLKVPHFRPVCRWLSLSPVTRTRHRAKPSREGVALRLDPKT